MNLTDTKTYTKKSAVRMDLSPVCFPVPPRAICSCEKQLPGQEEKSKNHNLAGKTRALGKYVAVMFGTGKLSPWAACSSSAPAAGRNLPFPSGTRESCGCVILGCLWQTGGWEGNGGGIWAVYFGRPHCRQREGLCYKNYMGREMPRQCWQCCCVQSWCEGWLNARKRLLFAVECPFCLSAAEKETRIVRFY